MPTYTAPGVYIEEVPSSQKVLSAAPTAVAAFVGFTERAPTDDPNDPAGLAPRLVTSWTQFEALYGGFAKDCVLPLSVYGYFANGGSYRLHLPHSEHRAGRRAGASSPCPAADRALGRPLQVESIEPDADIAIEIVAADVGDDAVDGAGAVHADGLLDGAAGRDVTRTSTFGAATATSRPSSTRPPPRSRST